MRKFQIKNKSLLRVKSGNGHFGLDRWFNAKSKTMPNQTYILQLLLMIWVRRSVIYQTANSDSIHSTSGFWMDVLFQSLMHGQTIYKISVTKYIPTRIKGIFFGNHHHPFKSPVAG